MYINMMPDIKRDSDLGNEESKYTQPPDKESKDEECKHTELEHKESKDEEENKVYEAMALSWGG